LQKERIKSRLIIGNTRHGGNFGDDDDVHNTGLDTPAETMISVPQYMNSKKAKRLIREPPLPLVIFFPL
jgi:hypothetical protein